MRPIKRVQVIVLLFVAAALLACSRADAAWCALTPTDEEWGASGKYCVERAVWAGTTFVGDVTVKCAGLTPGATYHVVVWDVVPWAGYMPVAEASFTTTKRGTGEVTVEDVEFWMLGPFYVEVRNARDIVVLTREY